MFISMICHHQANQTRYHSIYFVHRVESVNNTLPSAEYIQLGMKRVVIMDSD